MSTKNEDPIIKDEDKQDIPEQNQPEPGNVDQKQEKIERELTLDAQKKLQEISLLLSNLYAKIHEREFPELQNTLLERIGGIMRGIQEKTGNVSESFQRVLAKNLKKPYFETSETASDQLLIGQHLQNAKKNLAKALETSRKPISSFSEFSTRINEILDHLSETKKWLQSNGRNINERNIVPTTKHPSTADYVDQATEHITRILLDDVRVKPQEKLKMIKKITKMSPETERLLERALDAETNEGTRIIYLNAALAQNILTQSKMQQGSDAAKVEYWLKTVSKFFHIPDQPDSSEQTRHNHVQVFLDLIEKVDKKTALYKRMKPLKESLDFAYAKKQEALTKTRNDQKEEPALFQANSNLTRIESKISEFISEEFEKNSDEFRTTNLTTEFNAKNGLNITDFTSALNLIDNEQQNETKLKEACLLAANLVKNKKELKALEKKLKKKELKKTLGSEFINEILEISSIRLNGNNKERIRELLEAKRRSVHKSIKQITDTV